MTEPGPRPAAPYGDFQLEIYLAGVGVSLNTIVPGQLHARERQIGRPPGASPLRFGKAQPVPL
ncbi:MAG: hypothetical protein JWO75_3655 [Actinomycetia bacterium]|jgi:hypothetical protein|nr:hypothetical protein [Actinomycetes bacterium]